MNIIFPSGSSETKKVKMSFSLFFIVENSICCRYDLISRTETFRLVENRVTHFKDLKKKKKTTELNEKWSESQGQSRFNYIEKNRKKKLLFDESR